MSNFVIVSFIIYLHLLKCIYLFITLHTTSSNSELNINLFM